MTNKNLPAEKQFFAIETKGRNGVKDMVNHFQDSMWACKPSYLPSKSKKAYFERAIMNISNQESLKPLMANREGLFQIYLSLCKAVQLGMNVGGVRPHAYIVPRKKYENGQWKGQYVATFVPTQDGYRYVVTTGATKIFRDVLWGVVREGYTKFEIKESSGEIIYDSDPIKTAKGEILGVWVKCERINPDDTNIVKFVDIEKIHKIRNQYSESYKYAESDKGKKYNASSPWHTDYEEQCVKTALKSVLKHYISKCEGIAQLDQIEAEEAATYNEMDISDRMEQRLDNVIEDQDFEGDIITEKDIQENEEKLKEDKEPATENSAPDGQLF